MNFLRRHRTRTRKYEKTEEKNIKHTATCVKPITVVFLVVYIFCCTVSQTIAYSFVTATLFVIPPGAKRLKIKELWMIKITHQMTAIFIDPFCVDLALVYILVS